MYDFSLTRRQCEVIFLASRIFSRMETSMNVIHRLSLAACKIKCIFWHITIFIFELWILNMIRESSNWYFFWLTVPLIYSLVFFSKSILLVFLNVKVCSDSRSWEKCPRWLLNLKFLLNNCHFGALKKYFRIIFSTARIAHQHKISYRVRK